MSSVSPISGLAGGQAALWPISIADQVAQDLEVLLTALQSGDTAAAAQALTALQTLVKASAPLSALLSANPQVLGDLTLIRQALDSGDSAMISSAFAALQRDLTAAGPPALFRSPQLQRTPASASQEPGSGDSVTLNSVSAAFQKSAAFPAATPSSTNSAASPAYAATCLSAEFPKGRADADSLAIQAEANLLSAQSAEEAARLTIPVNPNVSPDLGPHGITYLSALVVIAVIVLLLFCLF
jgi:hypothetical protein